MSPLLSPEYEKHIHSLRQRFEVPGLAVTVVSRPSSEAERWETQIICSGEADPHGHAVNEDTLFSIASNSKFFTALAICMLIEDGVTLPGGSRLSMGTKIKDIISGWRLLDDYAQEHLDIKDLLAMQSGMPSHDYSRREIPLDQLPETIRHHRFSAEIRQTFQYSNFHYGLIPLLFEKLGYSFRDYIQKRIFDPVGMSSAKYSFVDAVKTGRMSMSYTRERTNSSLHRTASVDKEVDDSDEDLGIRRCLGHWCESDNLISAGQGGIIMSATDAAAWMRELLSPKHISQSVLDLATRPCTIYKSTSPFPEVSPIFYGLGQFILHYRGHLIYSHGGGLPGQLTWSFWLPNEGHGLFIATNDDVGGNIVGQAFSYGILDQLLGLEPINWESRFKKLEMERLASREAVSPPPKQPRATLPVRDIEGTYSDGAYSPVTLTAYSTEDLPELFSSILDRFRAETVFVSDFQSIFSSHLIFQPYDGPVLQWILVRIYANVAKDRDGGHAAWGLRTGLAVVKKDGIGMFGNFWGQGADIERRRVDESSTEETAEVWLEKLR